ncbi:hypothetical protein CRG86_010145 [Photobacterium leiognathi]|nr:hypothetical protein CRG86_010145 [Photobacterium leiognathi]
MRPKFKENLPLVKYGLYITAQNLVNYFSSRVDQLIIGKFLGADILGVYSTLKELLSKPVFQFINPMLNRVAFPVLSKSDLDKRITVYSRLNRIMYLISIPCFIVLYIHLDVFIKVALGEKWLSYIDISKYLILMLMIISIGNPVGILIKSFGKVKIGLIWEINVSIIRVLLLFIFVGYGINTLIISQIIYSLLILLFQYFFIVRKIIEYKFIDWLGNITFGLTFSLLIFFIHYVFVNYFNVYMLLLLEGSVFIFMVFTFKNKIKLS